MADPADKLHGIKGIKNAGIAGHDKPDGIIEAAGQTLGADIGLIFEISDSLFNFRSIGIGNGRNIIDDAGNRRDGDLGAAGNIMNAGFSLAHGSKGFSIIGQYLPPSLSPIDPLNRPPKYPAWPESPPDGRYILNRDRRPGYPQGGYRAFRQHQ